MKQFRLCSSLLALVMACEMTLAADYATSPEVAVDYAGNAVALWLAYDGDDNSYVQTASIPSGGSWTAATTISTPGQNVLYPIMDSDSLGNCVAVWSTIDPITNNLVLYGSMRVASGGGSWSTPTQISSSNYNLNGDYKVKINDGSLSDPVIAMWSAYDNTGLKIGVYASTTTFTTLGATWSTQVLVGGGI